MIHRHYHPDGTPDLRNWVLECDTCGRMQRALHVTSPQWLIPVHHRMAVYCPPCFNAWADHIIASALRCPECDYTHLRIWINTDPNLAFEDEHPHFIDCPRCGTVICIVDLPPFQANGGRK